MRSYGMLAVCLVCGLSVGCQENVHENQANQDLDVALVNSLNNLGVENAIIAQHTLYPYHFVSNAKELNELGQRDLAILIGHFVEHEGTLNIRRQETSPELYEARVTHVMAELKNGGVDTDRMGIADGMPGGDGMVSERVVTIMRQSGQPGQSGQSGRSTSSSGSLTR